MNPKDHKIAKELKERLSEVVELIDFKIFGSRARGDADNYSDMDIFIEVKLLNKELKEKVFDITWDVGFKHLIVVCPIIFTQYEIEESPIKSSPIVKNIEKEGIRI